MPEPTKAQQIAGNRNLPDAVKHFDTLPSQARINSRALKILLCVSDTTFWRRRKSGEIAEPDTNGTWSVGYARELLGANQEAA